MRVIKCDICGEELNNKMRYDAFGIDNNKIDLCEKCHRIYKDVGQSYKAERHEILEKKNRELTHLKEKFWEKIIELRKNS